MTEKGAAPRSQYNFTNVSENPPPLGDLHCGFSQIARFFPLNRNWHAPCKEVGIAGMVRREDPSGRITVTNYASSFAAQLGVGFISFVVSATCILAAVGPAHIAG
jgi:hypothetical protein